MDNFRSLCVDAREWRIVCHPATPAGPLKEPIMNKALVALLLALAFVANAAAVNISADGGVDDDDDCVVSV
jgi:hypothetical protein